MFALQPYSVVTRVAGESTRELVTITSSTLSPRTSFIFLHKFSNLDFCSSKAFFFVFIQTKVQTFFSDVHQFF